MFSKYQIVYAKSLVLNVEKVRGGVLTVEKILESVLKVEKVC